MNSLANARDRRGTLLDSLRGMRDPHLAAILASLVPIGLAASGCDSPVSAFDQRVCVMQQGAALDVHPADATDFMEVREKSFGSEPSAALSRWGAPCTQATNPDACSAQLAGLPFSAALVSRGFEVSEDFDVAVTRGDTVGTVITPDALLALLGPIDTPSEAALVVFAQGFDTPCDIDNVRAEGDHFVVLGTSGTTCGGDISHFEITVQRDGTVAQGESEIYEHGDPNCAIGRRPSSLYSRTRRSRSVGEFFAQAAHLEAASVIAFAELADELRAHRAPNGLVAASLRSRREEIGHARITARIARRFGGRPRLPVASRRGVRPLAAVALDNAVEGCVRETFGALVASVQAARAADRSVRRALVSIAADETRHAELSWSIDRWARSVGPAALGRRLDVAKREAFTELRYEIARHEWSPEVRVVAGMPDRETSLALVDALSRALT
jgi:hypothetical protein